MNIAAQLFKAAAELVYLRYPNDWAGDVMAAISTSNNELTFKSIREIMLDQ